MPRTRIIKAGIDVEKDMKPIFAGSHPTSVQAVATDKVQAGATFLTNLERMVKEKQVDFCWFSDGDFVKERSQKELDDLRATCKDGQIVVIAMSDPIPNTPFAINKNLPESFKKAVKDALLAIKSDPETVKGLGGWYVDPTEKLKDLKSVDSFYDGLREVAKLLNLELKSLVK
jgi:ABC-type phosphate/phosphonate transport system substrate-binding protein